jgi:ribosomal protein S12 methylthiotransferase accessory factor YcaO
MLERVRAVGVDHVIAFDLAPPDLPVSVVRVVAPGLEGYSHFPHYAPGPRGRAVREGRPEPQLPQTAVPAPAADRRLGR